MNCPKCRFTLTQNMDKGCFYCVICQYEKPLPSQDLKAIILKEADSDEPIRKTIRKYYVDVGLFGKLPYKSPTSNYGLYTNNFGLGACSVMVIHSHFYKDGYLAHLLAEDPCFEANVLFNIFEQTKRQFMREKQFNILIIQGGSYKTSAIDDFKLLCSNAFGEAPVVSTISAYGAYSSALYVPADETVYYFNENYLSKMLAYSLGARSMKKAICYSQTHPTSTRSDVHSGLSMKPFVEVPKSRWIPDSASNSCQICHKKFSLFFRRHHCRGCGKLICSECSRYIRETRICKECNCS